MKTLVEKCEYAKFAQDKKKRKLLQRGTLGGRTYKEVGCFECKGLKMVATGQTKLCCKWEEDDGSE